MNETGGLVVSMRAVRTDAWDRKDIKALDGRYRCLVRIKGYLLTIVLCKDKLSPSREYIHVGDHYTDQCRGWFAVGEIELVEVLGKVEQAGEPKLPWWKRARQSPWIPFVLVMFATVVVVGGVAVLLR